MLDRNKLPALTAKRLIDLLELPEESISFEDSAFLWARQGYLTNEEKERYARKLQTYKEKVMADNDYDGDSEKTANDPNEKPLMEYTRAELNKMATDIYGIEKVEEFGSKSEVINAIETAKASKAE